MIDRALKLKDQLEFYLYQNKEGTLHGSRRRRVGNLADPLLLHHDIPTESDWLVLKDTHCILEVFHKLTLCTQGKGRRGERGAVWEYLPSLNLLMESLKEKKRYYDILSANPEDSTPESRHFSACLRNAWLKVLDYVQRMDDFLVYVASCVLNPRLKWRFFETRWGNEDERVLQSQQSFQDFWDTTYKNRSIIQDETTTIIDPEAATDDLFDQYLTVPESVTSVPQEDSYASYCREPVNPKFEDLLQYWSLQENNYPDLAKMAYDLHSIPAMSAECERVFSSTKLLFTDLRARMGDDVIEASECLKSWSRLEFCTYQI